jgi:hypothetical protein
MYPNKIPSEREIKQILNAREQDILIRGEDHSVFDNNGKIVSLKLCTLWYDDNCNYVKPKSTQEIYCNIS